MVDATARKMDFVTDNDTITYLKEQGVLLTDDQCKILNYLSLQDLSNINFPKDCDDLCDKLQLNIISRLKFKTAIQNLQKESKQTPQYDTMNSDKTEYLITDNETRSLIVTELNDCDNTDISYSISLLGESNVGKTSIIQRFISDTFEDICQPTIGLDLCTKKVGILDKKCKLTLLDTAGQERFKSMSNWAYRVSHAFIICYDISDIDSFNKLYEWLQIINDKGNEYAKKFIVGTKIDIDEKERMISYNEGLELAKLNRCKFMEVSAKSGSNIKQLFTTVTLYLLRDRIMEKIGPSTIIGELDLTIQPQTSLKQKLSQWNDLHNPSPSTCKC
eukprot:385006_1